MSAQSRYHVVVQNVESMAEGGMPCNMGGAGWGMGSKVHATGLTLRTALEGRESNTS